MGDNRAENRVPVKLTYVNGILQCSWMNTYDKRFTEPFFDDTIFACRIRDQWDTAPPYTNSLFEMEMQGAALDMVVPSAIIFHLSRCGSTLVSQLFATSGRFIVLSEVPFFDEMLRLPLTEPGFDGAKIAALLSASLNFYGRKKYADEEYAVVKTDCWHIFFYDILREMFPTVPFVIMYRSPDEVFRSLNKIPGRQIVPGLVDPEIFGLPGMPDPYRKEFYIAAILEKMLEKFLEVAETDDNSLLVNYNEGPLNTVKKIAGFAGLQLDKGEIRAMEERALYHSKKPGELFRKEPAAEVPESLNGAMKLYQKLGIKRKMK